MSTHDPFTAFAVLLEDPSRTRRVLARLAAHASVSEPELRAAFDALADLLTYLACEEPVGLDPDSFEEVEP